MGIRRTLARMVGDVTGTHVFYDLPRGIDIFKDLAESLPDYRVDVVFDVGANRGQSALPFMAAFPSSRLYCFEPVTATYRKLERKMRGREHVQCFQLAMGSSQKQGTMVLAEHSERSYLVDEETQPGTGQEAVTERVDVVTLDDFCREQEIDHIGYLKVDTEGRDADVLKGAAGMLANQQIDLVEVEAGMNADNDLHVPLEVLKALLESHGYFIFGIYKQANEWMTKEPQLRRANPLFISRQMISRYRTDWVSRE